jgi:hypothetical protein
MCFSPRIQKVPAKAKRQPELPPLPSSKDGPPTITNCQEKLDGEHEFYVSIRIMSEKAYYSIRMKQYPGSNNTRDVRLSIKKQKKSTKKSV